MPAFTADDILRAFLARTAKDKTYVTFAERAPPNGYVRVYGPKANAGEESTCHVCVHHNGAVSVTDELRPHLSVEARPPHHRGRHRWNVTEQCASADDLVDRLIRAFAAPNLEW